jgi:hypothetical protein
MVDPVTSEVPREERAPIDDKIPSFGDGNSK